MCENKKVRKFATEQQDNHGSKHITIMENIILKELTLENWKKQNRHVVFGENGNKISGHNKSGKTTLMKAFFWLLSGYSDANTAQNSDLFDNTVEITKDTPKASVTAVVSINGEDYKLQKTAEAKFTRKRGTDQYEKAASDSYEMYIDDIQRNATDWKEWLAEHIAADDMMRFVLSGEFFVSKVFDDKKSARAIIERLVGKVDRCEMSGDYSCIDELLQKYSLDEIDARAMNLAKSIEQRLNEIPALIGNKETEISEIEQTDFAAVEREISQLEKERDDLDSRMTDLSERIRPQMEAKRKAEAEREMKRDVLNKAYSDWKKSISEKRDQLISKVNEIRRQNERSEQARKDAESKRYEASARQKRAIQLYDEASKKRERLINERDEAKAREFDPSSALCPFCGQRLEGEKLQEQIEKFEQRKRDEINRIVTEGKATSEEMKRLDEEIKSLHETISAPLPEATVQSYEEYQSKALVMDKLDLSMIAFTKTEQGVALMNDIDSVVVPEIVMPDNSEIVMQKGEVNAKLVPLYEKRGLKSRADMLRNAVEELRSEQKEKGALLADYERQRKAVKDYKQEQMEILSKKVNGGLKCSRIDVWSKQKDGTDVQDLVLKDEDGVNFATTNMANRIRVIADLQRLFCEKLGVNMPLWIDEVSVMQEKNIPCYEGVQTFLLFCSDTSLKIESK